MFLYPLISPHPPALMPSLPLSNFLKTKGGTGRAERGKQRVQKVTALFFPCRQAASSSF